MKRILVLSLVTVLGVLPSFSLKYLMSSSIIEWAIPLNPINPIIEPDPAFLPALLDSTIHYGWYADSGACILSWWIFALAIVIAFAIAFLTISWQAAKTARTNPVVALRYE